MDKIEFIERHLYQYLNLFLNKVDGDELHEWLRSIPDLKEQLAEFFQDNDPIWKEAMDNE